MLLARYVGTTTADSFEKKPSAVVIEVMSVLEWVIKVDV